MKQNRQNIRTKTFTEKRMPLGNSSNEEQGIDKTNTELSPSKKQRKSTMTQIIRFSDTEPLVTSTPKKIFVIVVCL